MRLILLFFLFYSPASYAASANVLDAADEDAVNLHCLRTSYPAIRALEISDDGSRWLVFADGRKVLYGAVPGGVTSDASDDPWSVDVRASMAEIYPLEPERPPTPPGVSPGRRRSYALLKTLYGADSDDVSKGICTVIMQGQPVHLTCAAAVALQEADLALTAAARVTPALSVWLKASGGFLWRTIAGERRLSPHAFGIALDLSANRAPYWRWGKRHPILAHPLQKGYPYAIVAAFEDQGFIWGGKWHEYDIMHFEYRPELVCKARIYRGLCTLGLDKTDKME